MRLPSALTLWWLILWLMLAACGNAPTATSAPAVSPTPSPTLAPPTPPPSPTPDANHLRVWLPEAFAPAETTPSGAVLAGQLAEFQTAHPAAQVTLRLKHFSGPGGLLRALIAAYNAAPSVLPNLIALPRDDVVTAYRAGLLLPLDSIIPLETLADYYPFAQTLSRVDNAFVCLPFAADARVLVYNTQTYPNPPLTWADILTGPFILPAAEINSLTVLDTYLALGGTLVSPSGQIVLDTELLAETFTLYQTAHEENQLPLSTLTYAGPEATWQVFRERRAALAVTSAQWFLAEYDRVPAAALTTIPTAQGTTLALADGWCWALVNTAPEQQPLAAELLYWLNEPEPSGAWTLAANLLPTRASTLKQWPPLTHTGPLDAVLRHAQLQPPAEVLARVGLPLRQALDDVLNGRASPFSAASSVTQALAQP